VDALSFFDLALSGSKALVFGLVVGLLGAFFGLRRKGGRRDVGRDTMRAVVWSSFLILFLDLTVTRVVTEVLR
jgi:phospholipid/cholesterol/gamma-HCH transport system permease protein